MTKKHKRSIKKSLINRLKHIKRTTSHILKELKLDAQEGAHTVGCTCAAVAKEIGPETKKVAQAAKNGVALGIEMVQNSYQGAVDGASSSIARTQRRVKHRK